MKNPRRSTVKFLLTCLPRWTHTTSVVPIILALILLLSTIAEGSSSSSSSSVKKPVDQNKAVISPIPAVNENAVEGLPAPDYTASKTWSAPVPVLDGAPRPSENLSDPTEHHSSGHQAPSLFSILEASMATQHDSLPSTKRRIKRSLWSWLKSKFKRRSTLYHHHYIPQPQRIYANHEVDCYSGYGSSYCQPQVGYTDRLIPGKKYSSKYKYHFKPGYPQPGELEYYGQLRQQQYPLPGVNSFDPYEKQDNSQQVATSKYGSAYHPSNHYRDKYSNYYSQSKDTGLEDGTDDGSRENGQSFPGDPSDGSREEPRNRSGGRYKVRFKYRQDKEYDKNKGNGKKYSRLVVRPKVKLEQDFFLGDTDSSEFVARSGESRSSAERELAYLIYKIRQKEYGLSGGSPDKVHVKYAIETVKPDYRHTGDKNGRGTSSERNQDSSEQQERGKKGSKDKKVYYLLPLNAGTGSHDGRGQSEENFVNTGPTKGSVNYYSQNKGNYSSGFDKDVWQARFMGHMSQWLKNNKSPSNGYSQSQGQYNFQQGGNQLSGYGYSHQQGPYTGQHPPSYGYSQGPQSQYRGQYGLGQQQWNQPVGSAWQGQGYPPNQNHQQFSNPAFSNLPQIGTGFPTKPVGAPGLGTNPQPPLQTKPLIPSYAEHAAEENAGSEEVPEMSKKKKKRRRRKKKKKVLPQESQDDPIDIPDDEEDDEDSEIEIVLPERSRKRKRKKGRRRPAAVMSDPDEDTGDMQSSESPKKQRRPKAKKTSQQSADYEDQDVSMEIQKPKKNLKKELKDDAFYISKLGTKYGHGGAKKKSKNSDDDVTSSGENSSSGPLVEAQTSEEVRHAQKTADVSKESGGNGTTESGEKHYYRRSRRKYKLVPKAVLLTGKNKNQKQKMDAGARSQEFAGLDGLTSAEADGSDTRMGKSTAVTLDAPSQSLEDDPFESPGRNTDSVEQKGGTRSKATMEDALQRAMMEVMRNSAAQRARARDNSSELRPVFPGRKKSQKKMQDSTQASEDLDESNDQQASLESTADNRDNAKKSSGGHNQGSALDSQESNLDDELELTIPGQDGSQEAVLDFSDENPDADGNRAQGKSDEEYASYSSSSSGPAAKDDSNEVGNQQEKSNKEKKSLVRM